MSKGSGRRPAQVSDETVKSNWDRVFGKPDDALRTESKSSDRHFEEAADISDEMQLHGDKHVPWLLKEQVD